MGHVLTPPVPRLAVEDPTKPLEQCSRSKTSCCVEYTTDGSPYGGFESNNLSSSVSCLLSRIFTLPPTPKLSWVGSGLQIMHNFFFLTAPCSLDRFPVSTDHRRLSLSRL